MNYFVIPGMVKPNKVRKESGYMKSNKIIQHVLSYFDITHEQLIQKTRKRHIVYRRQVMMYLLAKNTGLTFVKIGAILGMDHTSVIHSVKQLKDLMYSDSDIREEIEKLQESI